MIGQIQKRITEKRKNKESAEAEEAEKKEAEKVATELAEAEATAKSALDKVLSKIGNIVHQSVPVSKDEVRFEAFEPVTLSCPFLSNVGLASSSQRPPTPTTRLGQS